MDNTTLERWRHLDALEVLHKFADYVKQDCDFMPRERLESTRWFVTVGANDFELLCTGPKFWDVRGRVGGGGAIDLVMLLCNTDFRGAVVLLKAKGF